MISAWRLVLLWDVCSVYATGWLVEWFEPAATWPLVRLIVVTSGHWYTLRKNYTQPLLFMKPEASSAFVFLQPLCCGLSLPQRWHFGKVSQESGVHFCSASCISQLLSYYNIISLRHWGVKPQMGPNLHHTVEFWPRWLTHLSVPSLTLDVH